MPVTAPLADSLFVVIFEGVIVPKVSKVSSLEWSAEILTYNEGGSSVSISEPGKIKFRPLTLERELDSNTFFEEWAQLIAHPEPAAEPIFKDLKINILDAAGKTVVSYKVYRCLPMNFEAFSNLDADGTQVLKERLVLIYQSFERELSVVAPA